MFIFLIAYAWAISNQMLLTPIETDNDIHNRYLEALNNARMPQQSTIAYNLTALRADNRDLIFDKYGRVLLAFPILLSDYANVTQNIILYIDTFVTLSSQLSEKCKGFDDLRLKQF